MLQVLGGGYSLIDAMKQARSHEGGVMAAGDQWVCKQQMEQRLIGSKPGVSLQDLRFLGYFARAGACESPSSLF